MESHRNSLHQGYKLHWYIIKGILGQGGFGITYLAEDTNLHQDVAIKEFLPTDMAVRENDSSIHPVSGEYGEQFKWGLDRFMSEAQTLAKFKHPNIVRVLTVFPENNTAYMVMEYERGRAMNELLKGKNALSEHQLKSIALPVLDGLQHVHAAGFIHRDIKPPNLFIREDGSPVLLDFGSARQSFGFKTKTLTSMVSPGFAPFEQYVAKSDKQGPWTDIYGMGATLYRSIVGRSPTDAMDRSEAILHSTTDPYVSISEIKPEGYSDAFLAAIDHALAFKPEDRPQSVNQWSAELEGIANIDQADIETVFDPGSGVVLAIASNADVAAQKLSTKKTSNEPEPVAEEKKKKPSLLRRLTKYALIAFAVLFVLGILNKDKQKDQNGSSEPTVADDNVSTNTIYPAVDDTSIIEEETANNDATEVEPVIETSAFSDEEILQHRVKKLLTHAEEDIHALRLTKPADNNAIEKFQKVLSIDSENAEATNGIEIVAGKYLELSEISLNKNQFDKAEEQFALAKQLSPEHPGIELVESKLEQYLADLKMKQELEKQQTDIAIVDSPSVPELVESPPVSDRLTDQKPTLLSSKQLQNVSLLKDRIKNNPRDRAARKELQAILKSGESKVKEAIQAGDLELADSYIKQALELAPRSAKLRQAARKLDAKKKEQFALDNRPGKVFRDPMENGEEGPEMVIIPVGTFQMGSKREVRGNFAAEHPIHRVTIKQPFAMGTKELSVAEFGLFVEATDYQTEAEWKGGCSYWDEDWKTDPERNWHNPGFPQSKNNPVVCIGLNDVSAYIKWLTKQTGKKYRLPSEAEWEFAARAGSKGSTYWGTEMDRKCEYENLMDYNDKEDKPFYACTDGYTYTSPTGSFSSNAYGLYDMLGNVLELVADCFSETYNKASNDGSANTSGDCNIKVIRGGAWALPRGESEETPTVTNRIAWPQDFRGYLVGVRLLREL
jgi:formylglycine-generating enzyme required for sulfatase activity/serine/threonine protein kinase